MGDVGPFRARKSHPAKSRLSGSNLSELVAGDAFVSRQESVLNGLCHAKSWMAVVAELQEFAMFLRTSALWFAADVHFD